MRAFLSEEAALYHRRVLVIVTLTGLLAAGQAGYALSIGNRHLFKDAVDWGYDIALWLMALAVFGRGRKAEDIAALGVGLIMLIAAAHTGYDLWDKIATGRRAEPWVAGWAASSAIIQAIFVVAMLLRFRNAENPLILATWLSSRNSMASTTAYAVIGYFARTATSQAYEIALDLFAISLNLQAAISVARAVQRDWGRRAPGDGQAGGGVASSDSQAPT